MKWFCFQFASINIVSAIFRIELREHDLKKIVLFDGLSAPGVFFKEQQ